MAGCQRKPDRDADQRQREAAPYDAAAACRDGGLQRTRQCHYRRMDRGGDRDIYGAQRQRLQHQRAAVSLDELGQHGDVKYGGLWIEQVGHQPAPECRPWQAIIAISNT